MYSKLENFLRKKKLICYGGTAINNILPKNDRFYDFDKEIPDYDFFSKDALDDAKELADIYYKEGFKEVQAKAGVHHGTYKVFVNFTGIADITQLEPQIYNKLMRYGVNLVTLGDHTYRKRDIIKTLETEENIARPANFSEPAAGRGFGIYKTSKGPTVGVAALIGRLFMKPADCPYNAIDKTLPQLEQKADIIRSWADILEIQVKNMNLNMILSKVILE